MRRALAPEIAGCLVLVLAATRCGQRRVEIIGGLPDSGDSPTPCPATLAERLQFVAIPVDRDIAWQKQGYDRFPVDERVALAVQPDGQAQIAWLEVNPATVAGGGPQPPLGVHVTPLDATLARRAADVVLPTGQEVSGLVAHDDGFALLFRDENPGTPIDLGDGNAVAFLSRHQDGLERWRVPLTGSLSEDATESRTLYSPFLDGQLVWNDSTYGAYFAVRGGKGDPAESYWHDALVFRDSFLRPAPWPMASGCQNNGGIRLIADNGKVNLVGARYASLPQMTGLCVQQGRPGLKFTELESDRPVSDQEVQWAGYSGAKLGSLVKIADGYLVFWLSLGDTNEHQGHDIRMARLDTGFNVVGGPLWLTRTPGVEEWNLHVVPYGPGHFVMVYVEIAITEPAPGKYAMYLGNFVGTHLVLLDGNGAPLSNELAPGAPTTANAEPVVLPSGDVAWPFVNPAPDFTRTVSGPNGPGQTTLHIARLRYCE
ncbi:MAG: hypothetical protein JXP73_01210 [Deltaproteobacteria bacterium]|nr:hypothetical protein [Deltaproteobacteria bacterium]